MVTVYALIEPQSQEIRYIGQSRHVHSRYRQHTTAKTSSAVSVWVRELAARGLSPEMTILERDIPKETAKDTESFWITYFRFIGANLLNSHGVPENMKWDRRRKDKFGTADKGDDMQMSTIKVNDASGKRTVCTVLFDDDLKLSERAEFLRNLADQIDEYRQHGELNGREL